MNQTNQVKQTTHTETKKEHSNTDETYFMYLCTYIHNKIWLFHLWSRIGYHFYASMLLLLPLASPSALNLFIPIIYFHIWYFSRCVWVLAFYIPTSSFTLHPNFRIFRWTYRHQKLNENFKIIESHIISTLTLCNVTLDYITVQYISIASLSSIAALLSFVREKHSEAVIMASDSKEVRRWRKYMRIIKLGKIGI